MAFAGRIYKDRTSTRGVTTIVEARISAAVPAVGAITPSVRGTKVIVVLVVLQMQFVRSAEVYYYGLLVLEVER
jgi:hypothetical protein